MSTELAVVEGNGVEPIPAPVHVSAPNVGGLEMLPAYVELVKQIAATPFVPEALRGKPHEILACLMKGYELGMGPMQSLDSIDVIKGKPSLKPEAMRALAAQAGHSIRVTVNTEEQVTIAVHRREWPADQWDEFTWTMADARRANLTGNQTWKSYPRAMLLARVTSEACRAVLGDVIKGLSYGPEEVESFSPVAAPPGVDGSTGEIAGGGEAKGTEGQPTSPPASVTTRPPPARARSSAPKVDTTAETGAQAPQGTITAAALDSLLGYAARKKLTKEQLTEMAGKPLDTLTMHESQELTTKVTAHKAEA